MEELNRRGKAFVNGWCNEVHRTTKRISNQHYLLEEKSSLLPLPKTHYRIKNLRQRIISPDSYISRCWGRINKFILPQIVSTLKISHKFFF